MPLDSLYSHGLLLLASVIVARAFYQFVVQIPEKTGRKAKASGRPSAASISQNKAAFFSKIHHVFNEHYCLSFHAHVGHWTHCPRKNIMVDVLVCDSRTLTPILGIFIVNPKSRLLTHRQVFARRALLKANILTTEYHDINQPLQEETIRFFLSLLRTHMATDDSLEFEKALRKNGNGLP